MIVHVLFFGVLKELTGISAERIELPDGFTVEQLFERYAQGSETLRAARPSILFARNREFTKGAERLNDLDEVAFLPPVSGGSGAGAYSHKMEEKGFFFALTRAPIDRASLISTLQRPEDGAVVLFDGVVRNNTKGRKTLYLEYECYEAMAIRQMEAIGRETAQQHALGGIGIIHRLGPLAIGEASVSIVAASAHRKAAFAAALQAIDRLKREVPIWKKEFFEDGEVWIEGEWDDTLAGRQQPETAV